MSPLIAISTISIHAPAWGATHYAARASFGCKISIHAPAWGATAFVFRAVAKLIISIHAPAWGATPSCFAIHAKPSYFNPRARMGARPLFLVLDLNVVEISIHAPAWGRDRPRCSACGSTRYFNPRARMGARRIHAAIVILAVLFQSTRPHGGATRIHHASSRCVRISIHAPAWGRDLSYLII